MPVPTDITAGTIAISGTTVTGVGTNFVASDVRQGDIFIWVEGGAGSQVPIVATVNSPTSITLAEPWTGAAIPAGSRYRLRYQWDSSRVSAQSRQLIDLLDNGKLQGLAGLAGGVDQLPYFNDLNSFAQTPLTAFARTLLDDTTAIAARATLGVREVLTGDQTYYVRLDGSNANTGLVNSAGGAFLTLQYAINVVAALDRSIYNVTIQLGAGTFTSGGSFTGMGPGLGFIQINGSGIANTTIATSGASHNCIITSSTRRLRIANMRLETTATSSSCVRLDAGSQLERIENVDFGPAVWAHIGVLGGSYAFLSNAYTISGSAPMHIRIEQGGGYVALTSAVTITGTPNWSSTFARAAALCYLFVTGASFTGGATGKRYDVINGGVLQSSVTLPGDVAGTGTNFGVAPWGLYA
jgi:hypothetical protein